MNSYKDSGTRLIWKAPSGATSNTEKNGFVSATQLGTTNIFFVAATKNFAGATKCFVDRTKHFVVVTKYLYPHFNKRFCWYNKTFYTVIPIRFLCYGLQCRFGIKR